MYVHPFFSYHIIWSNLKLQVRSWSSATLMKSKIWDMENKSSVDDLKFVPKAKADPSETISTPTAVQPKAKPITVSCGTPHRQHAWPPCLPTAKIQLQWPTQAVHQISDKKRAPLRSYMMLPAAAIIHRRWPRASDSFSFGQSKSPNSSDAQCWFPSKD